MDSRTIPYADMLQVSKSAKIQRKAILKFVPPIGLSCVNYRSLGEIDYFYLDCQDYRDYYRDTRSKLHRPQLFCNYHGVCGKKRDYNLELLNQPVRWVVERKPVVYPLDTDRHMNMDGIIRIGAHFSPNSTTVFKR